MKRRDFSFAAISAAAVTNLPVVVHAQGPAPAKKPVEGTDYLPLDKRVPTDVGVGKIEVIEFFWYSCPHCNAFEPQFAAWKKAAPKDVVIQRVPVRFRDDFEPQQRTYYVLEALNMVDALHGKLFHAIHRLWQLGLTRMACQKRSSWRPTTASVLPAKRAVPRSCKKPLRCKACRPWAWRGVSTPMAL